MTKHNAWIIGRINEAIPATGPWQPSEVAATVVAQAKSEDPDAFNAWMHHQAQSFVQHLIVERHRADRARAFQQSKASVFADAAKRTRDGDGDAFDPYLIPYVIDDQTGTRLTLGEMTGNDCHRAASGFRRREQENAMQAAFLEALADKAQRRKVKNVLTREQITSMLSSIGMRVAA